MSSKETPIERLRTAFPSAMLNLSQIIALDQLVESPSLNISAVAHEALIYVNNLLQFNSSNQKLDCHLFLSPCSFSREYQFALQFRDNQKLANALAIVAIIGLLIGSKGYGGQDSYVFTRCLIEIALASNAPTSLKMQHLVPANLNFLSELIITPYMPVPETNGKEWDRLEAASALDALVELALNREYNGQGSARRLMTGLELRTAAVGVFEPGVEFVRKEEIKYTIISAMVVPEGADPSQLPPTPLLQALSMSPETSGPLNHVLVSSAHFASLLFSHLLRSSPRCKTLARSIKPQPPTQIPSSAAGGGSFFVPADGPAPEPTPAAHEEDNDPPQTLLQILAEHLSLAFLSRSKTDTSDLESREWDRMIVGYLTLLCQWLWEDPAAVRDFLTQAGWEYATISPILNRLGVDTLLGRMARLREDEHFKTVSPETLVQYYPRSAPRLQATTTAAATTKSEAEGEVWFDWAFVDFWKSNYLHFASTRAFYGSGSARFYIWCILLKELVHQIEEVEEVEDEDAMDEVIYAFRKLIR
ncbi:hypothetical protein BT96DRAFT_1004432 [Gymnopus androsaceus JB14]|uniref:Vesicle tethering protein Uso1/P115-like head domain-containing protein n=1 Tax=Gymnopus androsaceus JB14 TaxID=1447944 RepID=A0A6A4GQX7_9AGAR|nr:hypothetical protein BT96DRAFT_1004432 [Gymnopus androsaceus JB14]